MCPIHEARHSIYMREYLGEQDKGVGVSFVRNLLESRSKWSVSQANLHLLETRLKTVLDQTSALFYSKINVSNT